MTDMAEEKETDFKITDRRKFNSDGSPREQSEQPAAAQVEQDESRNETPVEAEDQPRGEGARNNVVSFPGEPAKKKEQAQPDQAPAADQPAGQQADAPGLDAQAKAAASAAEHAYNQTR